MDDHLRFHAPHQHLAGTFGSDWFGALAERIARFFGTPVYLIGQTGIVAIWVTVNGMALAGVQFDPYPFILLNLAFSLQAAYAAPLIRLAQTRQSERDKVWSDADAQHREALNGRLLELLEQNVALTQQVHALSAQVRDLTGEIHAHIVSTQG